MDEYLNMGERRRWNQPLDGLETGLFQLFRGVFLLYTFPLNVQLCASCLSPNDDERPAKAKTRKRRRFRMKTKVVRSKTDAPAKETKISNKPGKNSHEAASKKSADYTSQSDGQNSLRNVRDNHVKRPLPVPSTRHVEVSTKSRPKKAKGTPPCKGCVNAQHDPWKVRHRLASIHHQDNRIRDTDPSASLEDERNLLEQIDMEIRKKVEKVFGSSTSSSVFRQATHTSKRNADNAEGKRLRTRRQPPDIGRSNDALVDWEHFGNVRRSKKEKEVKHRKSKIRRGNNTNVVAKDTHNMREYSETTVQRNQMLETDGYETHDDDDDIGFGIRHTVFTKNSGKRKRGKETIETNGYEKNDDDDDDDEIIYGIHYITPKSNLAERNIKKDKAEGGGYENHEDDDDIVYGKPDKYLELPKTSYANCTDKQNPNHRYGAETNRFEETDEHDEHVSGNRKTETGSGELNFTSASREDTDEAGQQPPYWRDKFPSGQNSRPERSGFAEMIKGIPGSLGETTRTSSGTSLEKNPRDLVNRLYSGCTSQPTAVALSGSQLQTPGYDVVIKQLTEKLSKIKSSHCAAQEMNRKLAPVDIINPNPSQFLSSKMFSGSQETQIEACQDALSSS